MFGRNPLALPPCLTKMCAIRWKWNKILCFDTGQSHFLPTVNNIPAYLKIRCKGIETFGHDSCTMHYWVVSLSDLHTSLAAKYYVVVRWSSFVTYCNLSQWMWRCCICMELMKGHYRLWRGKMLRWISDMLWSCGTGTLWIFPRFGTNLKCKLLNLFYAIYVFRQMGAPDRAGVFQVRPN